MARIWRDDDNKIIRRLQKYYLNYDTKMIKNVERIWRDDDNKMRLWIKDVKVMAKKMAKKWQKADQESEKEVTMMMYRITILFDLDVQSQIPALCSSLILHI